MTLQEFKEYTNWVFISAVKILLLLAFLDLTPIGRDTSDPNKWGKRSGIAVRTDALTGCQYLADQNGGFTPRVSRTQEHLGCK